MQTGNWKLDVSHVPKATKADFRLYQVRFHADKYLLEKKMLIGTCQDLTPVHAVVRSRNGGPHNLA
jgi:hypothetical protein